MSPYNKEVNFDQLRVGPAATDLLRLSRQNALAPTTLAP